MLALGSHMMSTQQAIEIVGLWLKTPFDSGRHIRRIEKIENSLLRLSKPS